MPSPAPQAGAASKLTRALTPTLLVSVGLLSVNQTTLPLVFNLSFVFSIEARAPAASPKDPMKKSNVTTHDAETSPLVRARVAGALYLFANILAPFTLLYLPSRFIVRGDPAATASHIMGSESLFRFGIVGNLFTFTANIFLALALFQLLKVVSRNIAFVMLILLLVGVPIAMLNELTQLAVLQLLSGAGFLKAYTVDQLQVLAYLLLRLHDQGLLIAHIFFGLWLLPMGYLVFKSRFIPRVVGLLLVIAGAGYVVQSFGIFLGYSVNIIMFTGLGEAVFLLWLLIRGVNGEQWKKRALESQ